MCAQESEGERIPVTEYLEGVEMSDVEDLCDIVDVQSGGKVAGERTLQGAETILVCKAEQFQQVREVPLGIHRETARIDVANEHAECMRRRARLELDLRAGRLSHAAVEERSAHNTTTSTTIYDPPAYPRRSVLQLCPLWSFLLLEEILLLFSGQFKQSQ